MHVYEREFDPDLDQPLRMGRKNPLRGTRPDVATSRQTPYPPMGEYVWRITREVILDGPFESAGGKSWHKWVYHTRGKKTFVRPWVMPADPKTSFQTSQRQRLIDAQREWQRLNDAQREGWNRAAHDLDRSMASRTPGRRKRAGMNLFAGAQIQRLSWGEAMRHDPPAATLAGSFARRPSSIFHLHEVPVAEGEGFAFRIDHLQKEPAGCQLLVEMTPATKSPANKPLERCLTKAGATDEGSYFALQPTGGTYLLPQLRSAVVPGQRFAIRVTIVDADGLRGRAYMADLIREQHVAPEPVTQPAAMEPVAASASSLETAQVCGDAVTGIAGILAGSYAVSCRQGCRRSQSLQPAIESAPLQHVAQAYAGGQPAIGKLTVNLLPMPGADST